MNEDEISETLARVVPHREVPEGMLVGARRRRRRTRVFTGAAAVALVAALAIPLGLTMGGASQQVLATPAPTTSGTVVPELAGGYDLGGTYNAVGGIEYRDGRVSLCYSIVGWPTRSCGASIPLLGQAAEAYPWTSGSVANGRAFTEAEVMGTLTPEGMHVVLVNPPHGIPGTPVPVDAPDELLDGKALSLAADSLLAGSGGDPYAPTTEIKRFADADWDWLVVHVLISTDAVLTDLETRLGPDVWLQTRVQPLLVPYSGDEVEPMPNPTSDAPTPPPSVLPQFDGTYVAQGGVEYRNGRLSLCYSIAVSEIEYCKAAVPLFGLDPEDLDWEQGSVAAGHAFTHAGVAATIESGGLRVGQVLENPVTIGGPGRLPLAKDPELLPSAAADLVASYEGDPFAPTTKVDDAEIEGDRLVVHVLLATDEVVADIRQRLGEDVWQYTDVESFMSRLET